MRKLKNPGTKIMDDSWDKLPFPNHVIIMSTTYGSGAFKNFPLLVIPPYK